MNRQILKSNSAFVAIGNDPAWTTGADNAAIFSLVQGCDFSISTQRQKLKQIGSQSLAVNDIVRAPEVAVNFNYFLTPYLNNELLAGFKGESVDYQVATQSMRARSQNFYVIMNPSEIKDAIDPFKATGTAMSGLQALTFGNCYLTRYSAQFGINTVPVATMNFVGDNMRFENITGSRISIPAINSASGNSNGSGYLDLASLYNSLTGGYISGDIEGRQETNAPVSISNKGTYTLQNLEIGGAPLDLASKPILQTFDLGLDFARTPLYGLGSNYPYGRKLELPVNGTASFNCLVSGVSSGSIQSLLTKDTGYSFEVAFTDQRMLRTGFFKIDNAKLDSVNYSMSINGVLAMSASFSFQASETGGFYIKRSLAGSLSNQSWQSVSDIWQNISVNWLNV